MEKMKRKISKVVIFSGWCQEWGVSQEILKVSLDNNAKVRNIFGTTKSLSMKSYKQRNREEEEGMS